jgi:hypothetical protein
LHRGVNSASLVHAGFSWLGSDETLSTPHRADPASLVDGAHGVRRFAM